MFGSTEARIVNGLIEVTLDSADGYRMAAERVDNFRFQELFQQWAEERQDVVGDLQSEINRLGEEPKVDGSMMAAAHRTFMDLRDAVFSDDDEAIIKEVERGETHLKTVYDQAIAQTDLESGTIGIINNAYEKVRSSYDKFHRLKNKMGT